VLDFLRVSDSQPIFFAGVEVFCISGMQVGFYIHSFSFLDDQVVAGHIQGKRVCSKKQTVIEKTEFSSRSRSPVILGAKPVCYVEHQFVPDDRESMNFCTDIEK